MKEHNFEDGRCTECGERNWIKTLCTGVKKLCTYPECSCPFDMGPEHKCFRGYDND